MDERLALIKARNDEEPAVIVRGYGGQWRAVQTLRGGFRSLGFQAKLARSQQQAVLRKGLVRAAKLMGQLLLRGRHLMEARKHDQRGQASVEARGMVRHLSAYL